MLLMSIIVKYGNREYVYNELTFIVGLILIFWDLIIRCKFVRYNELYL